MRHDLYDEKELLREAAAITLHRDYELKTITDREAGIPVIRPETSKLLTCLLRKEKPSHILDLGTGGGCSALICLLETDAQGTTAELDEGRLLRAAEMLRRYGFEHRVNCVCADIGEFLQSLDGKYDFIISDWAKAQYVRSLDELERLSADGALLLFDDANFYGMVDGTGRFFRRRRTIVSRLKELPEALEQRGWPIQYIDIDNGILLARVIHKD